MLTASGWVQCSGGVPLPPGPLSRVLSCIRISCHDACWQEFGRHHWPFWELLQPLWVALAHVWPWLRFPELSSSMMLWSASHVAVGTA